MLLAFIIVILSYFILMIPYDAFNDNENFNLICQISLEIPFNKSFFLFIF